MSTPSIQRRSVFRAFQCGLHPSPAPIWTRVSYLSGLPSDGAAAVAKGNVPPTMHAPPDAAAILKGQPQGAAKGNQGPGPQAAGDDHHLRKLAAMLKPNPGDPSNYAGTNKQVAYTIRNAPGANIYMTTTGMASATV